MHFLSMFKIYNVFLILGMLGIYNICKIWNLSNIYISECDN